jgi:hypothetical protein
MPAVAAAFTAAALSTNFVIPFIIELGRYDSMNLNFPTLACTTNSTVRQVDWRIAAALHRDCLKTARPCPVWIIGLLSLPVLSVGQYREACDDERGMIR